MTQQKTTLTRRPKARRWPLWIIIGALALGGAAFGLWQVRGAASGQSANPQAAAKQQPAAYQTAAVRRGDLALSATGTGKVVPAQTVDLGFASSGSAAQVNVKVGDTVTAGQILAVQDGTDALKHAVDQKQLDLISAQQVLDQLTANSAVNLAQAAADLAAAQQASALAQNKVVNKHTPRCDPNLTESYYWQYLSYQIQASPWEKALDSPTTGYSHNYIMQNLNPIKAKENQAYYNWQWCQNYTDLEIQASQAALQVAQANMRQAQAKYQALSGDKGVDPNALALAQATLANAQKQFDLAQANLNGATIVAPFSGTVTAVSGDQLSVTSGQASGQLSANSSSGSSSSSNNSNSSSASSSGNSSSANSSSSSGSGAGASAASSDTPPSALMTIADVSHPLVQVNIDETDLANFAAGCPAQVTFTALPGQAFTGKVTQVYPSLATVNNSSEAQGLVQLNQPAAAKNLPANKQQLPLGLDAQVTVTCQQAANVLLVPVQAVHQASGQPAYVYLLNAQGQPVKREVQVGLQSTAFAEIKSGLQAGDTVITSPVKP